MKYFFLCLLATCSLISCEPTKYLYYSELKNNLADQKHPNILIVGTGTSGTNLFLTTLSEELNTRLKNKNITTVYHHLGNNRAKANEAFQEIVSKNKYDAVLHFAQLDETHDPVILSYNTNRVPVGNGYVNYSYSTRNIRFQQKFLMRYFQIDDLTNSMVDADLDLSIDFVNKGDYSELSDYIISSLKIK